MTKETPEMSAKGILGERRICIDGVERTIRMHLLAQQEIIEALGLETIAELPRRFVGHPPDVMAVVIRASLIGEPSMTLDEVRMASMSQIHAVKAVFECMNLNLVGNPEGSNPFPDEVDDEDEAEEDAEGK